MIGHLKRVHEALLGSHHAGTKTLRQREVHQVVHRSVVGNGEPDGVGADGLVRIPSNRMSEIKDYEGRCGYWLHAVFLGGLWAVGQLIPDGGWVTLNWRRQL